MAVTKKKSTSLKQDIFDAFNKSMGGGINPTSEQGKNITQLSKDLSDAFINFLDRQELRVTDLQANLDVDQISTTGPLSSIAAPYYAQTPSWPAGVSGPLQPVLINPLFLSKKSILGKSQGGSLSVKGIAKVKLGNPTNSPGNYGKVKFYKNKVKGE